jgi:hypothetical protein
VVQGGREESEWNKLLRGLHAAVSGGLAAQLDFTATPRHQGERISRNKSVRRPGHGRHLPPTSAFSILFRATTNSRKSSHSSCKRPRMYNGSQSYRNNSDFRLRTQTSPATCVTTSRISSRGPAMTYTTSSRRRAGPNGFAVGDRHGAWTAMVLSGCYFQASPLEYATRRSRPAVAYSSFGPGADNRRGVDR